MHYALVTEGGDDRMLSAPIEWLMNIHCKTPFSGLWANPAVMEDRSRDLAIRLSQAKRFYPADLYMVHRDTDTATRDDRVREIVDGARDSALESPFVCVIPVRMTEAWFLFSEEAIRRAADRASGRAALNLPNSVEIQRRADPKSILEDKLVLASELAGRRLAQFRAELGRRKSLVASVIGDFSPLRRHDAFNLFEAELVAALRAGGWSD